MRVGVRRSLVFFLLLAAPIACRRSPPPSPWRPPPGAGPAQSLLDSDRIRREGVAVSGAVEWALPRTPHSRLRVSWTSTGPAREATLVAELVRPSGRGARVIGRGTRTFPRATGAVEFFDEDWRLPEHENGSRLRLRVEPSGPFFLSDLRVVRPDARARSVLLVLFDTTRPDALGLYGCPDPSTPNLDAIFRGAWKSTRAYAAASWTIPSVASLLTGRVPAVEEDPEGAPRGIVSGMATLAADFRRAGWSTSAFIANPTLNADNGFAQGFTTFFTTPYEVSSMTLPAGETTRRMPRWLATHRGEPFFAFLLLLDPHDPYTAPDRPRGSTPFDPDYRGSFVGDEIHSLQLGELPRPAERDIRHLRALYHDEVRYADSRLGELWNALDSDEQARATVVFTSDHGEEFGEHGGWKHGPTLFDEVLRVPLLLRPGAGRPRPAASADALVSLLDLLPTIEALEGLPPPGRPLEGRNLIAPDAPERASLPAVTMLTGGGARAAIVHPSSKLVFFDRLGDRGVPDAKTDLNGRRLALRLRDLLPGLGRFDLLADPGETRLLPVDEKTFASDWRAVERAISGTREGLELRFLGRAGSPPLRLRVEGFPVGSRAQPFGLEPSDEFGWRETPTGSVLTARLEIAADVDGFLVTGPPSDLKMTVESEGCVELTISQSRILTSGRVEAIPLAAVPATLPRFDLREGCSGVFVWRAARGVPVAGEETDERIRKLRALGYLH